VQEVATALGLTLLIGSILGYAFYRFGAFRAATEPVLVAFYSAPAILLYPIFLTFLGQGSATVITMAVILGAVPIAINMAVGLSGIAPIWRKVGRSLHAGTVQMLTRILIPAATPVIVTGFRVGLTFALIGVISLEFLTYADFVALLRVRYRRRLFCGSAGRLDCGVDQRASDPAGGRRAGTLDLSPDAFAIPRGRAPTWFRRGSRESALPCWN
jgi:NitT/TauT family transport system permease protein